MSTAVLTAIKRRAGIAALVVTAIYGLTAKAGLPELQLPDQKAYEVRDMMSCLAYFSQKARTDTSKQSSVDQYYLDQVALQLRSLLEPEDAKHSHVADYDNMPPTLTTDEISSGILLYFRFSALHPISEDEKLHCEQSVLPSDP